MSKLDVEAVKRASRGLRGSIPEELAAPIDHFGEESVALLKFHGVYQQDDRDARKSAARNGRRPRLQLHDPHQEPGRLSAGRLLPGRRPAQRLFGNGTIRITTRGALQLHGVLKSNLHEVIHQMNEHLGLDPRRVRRHQPQRDGDAVSAERGPIIAPRARPRSRSPTR